MNASIEKYLKVYNVIQFIAWFTALMFLKIDFEIAINTILFFQLISLVEVFHAKKKWVQSSSILCFVQIIARLFILFLVYALMLQFLFEHLDYFKETVKIMLVTWCIAEVIRYFYYSIQLFKIQNKIITWLRYTAFIFCYPIGLACELFIIYLAFKNNSTLIIKLLLLFVVFAYIYFFPKLFLHLLKQRKNKLHTIY